VHREEAMPPAYLPHMLQPVTRDGRHGHTTAVEVPPRVRPRDGIAPGVEPAASLTGT
jgi:hypothetical protein